MLYRVYLQQLPSSLSALEPASIAQHNPPLNTPEQDVLATGIRHLNPMYQELNVKWPQEQSKPPLQKLQHRVQHDTPKQAK